jgi:integrase
MYNSNYKENDLFSQRTICACLLAYAGFLRVSELLQIRGSNITFEATYICIFIPNSKTDIYRDCNSVVIVRTDSNLCPVKNLELYLIWGNILANSMNLFFVI